MPDIVNHYLLGDRVYASLSEENRSAIRRDVYDLATIGPDVWFSYRFWMPPKKAGMPRRGSIMHHEKTGDFLAALADGCRNAVRNGKREASDHLFSYLAGTICHYALDGAAHPFIVYHAGVYDGTEKTRVARGNHMALERALDHLALKRWGKTLREKPINRFPLRIRRMPNDMRDGVNEAYRSVYGWENVWDTLNVCTLDQRRFYALAQDPHGLLKRVLLRADNGTAGQDLRVISYYGMERPDLDVENGGHRTWRNPWAPELTSSASFPELFELAAAEAASMIAACRAYVESGDRELLLNALGNRSYGTGLDCNDPREKNTPVCDPIF